MQSVIRFDGRKLNWYSISYDNLVSNVNKISIDVEQILKMLSERLFEHFMRITFLGGRFEHPKTYRRNSHCCIVPYRSCRRNNNDCVEETHRAVYLDGLIIARLKKSGGELSRVTIIDSFQQFVICISITRPPDPPYVIVISLYCVFYLFYPYQYLSSPSPNILSFPYTITLPSTFHYLIHYNIYLF